MNGDLLLFAGPDGHLVGRGDGAKSGTEKRRTCMAPPKILLNGFVCECSCRKCKNCIRARKRVFFGRCLAEWQEIDLSQGDHAYWLTLTYGRDDHYRLCDSFEGDIVDEETGQLLACGIGDGQDGNHPHARRLVYRDMQIYFKRLRKNLIVLDPNKPHSVRYMVTGEYGVKKGRAHWHIVLFLKNCDVPNIRLYERYDHEAETLEQGTARGSRYKRAKLLWHHGFSYWEELSVKRIAYTAKYIGKDLGKGRKNDPDQAAVRVGCSPGLGSGHCERLAVEHARQGLPLRDRSYEIPGHERRNATVVTDGDGLRILLKPGPERFQMSRSIIMRCCRAYNRAWEEVHGAVAQPVSRVMQWFEPLEAERVFALERRRRLRAAGADVGEYGNVLDQKELEVNLTKRRDVRLVKVGPFDWKKSGVDLHMWEMLQQPSTWGVVRFSREDAALRKKMFDLRDAVSAAYGRHGYASASSGV